MKKLLLFWMLLASCYSFGTHVVGGELIYQHLGGSSYLLTCKFYRDCCGSCFDFPTTVRIFVRTGAGAIPATPAVGFWDLPIQGRDTLSPPLDTCAVDPGICVEEAIFSSVVSLPAGIGGYHLWLGETAALGFCCRNNSIDNITAPGTMREIFYAYVPDNNLWLTNSSPVFSSFPPVFVCKDYDLNLDFSATDADGDDLVYSFYTPHNNFSSINGLGTPPDNITFTSVGWVAGFSANDPLNPAPGVQAITISPSGIINGIPTTLGQYVVGVMIEEFRDGVKIGEITRDFQFNVVVCPPPQDAGIGPVDACAGLSIDFINDSGAGANGFWWDFGTGNPADTSIVFEPTFSYPSLGTYPVTLMAQKGTLCADTTYYTLIVSDLLGDFSAPDTVCVGEMASFTDLSVPAFNGVVDQWEWAFGDGGTSVLQNPNHTYAVSGLQNVQFIAHTDVGCSDTITKQVYVKVPPQAAIAPLPGCNGLNVNFINASDPTATGLWWEFGTGFPADTSLLTNPSFDYTSNGYGSYTVSLVAQKGTSCADTATYLVLISNVVADFADLDTTCTNVLVSYTDQSSNVNGSITQWEWDFGDVSTTTITNPTHGYSVAGDYDVELIVTSSLGCKDTIVKQIHVDDAPQAIIGATDFCSGQTINFVNGSGVGATGFWWDFGTGNPADSSVVTNPTFVYGAFGNYTVTLIAQKGTVCETSTTLPITISNLIPDFDLPTDACINSLVSFLDQSSTTVGSNIIGYEWEFGDLIGTSTSQNPTYNYSTSGVMPVQLVVTTNAGCSDTLVQNINIQALPIANAGPDTAVCVSNPGLVLNGIITGATGGLWIPNGGAFVPGATNMGATYFPSLAEMNNGITQIVLTTTGNGFCPSQTDTLTISYLDTPDINTGGDIDVCEDSLYVPLNATVQFAANIIWTTNGTGSFDDPSLLNAVYTFSPADISSGQITLYIETFNSSGCPDDQDSLFINFNQPPTMMVVYDDTVCAGFPIPLESNSSTGNGWWQTTGDGNFTPDDSSAMVFYNHGISDETTGLVQIYFQTIDNGGCNALYDTLDLVIVPSPTPGFTFTENCFGTATPFINTSTSIDPIIGYDWTFEVGGTSNSTNPTYTFLTDGPHNVQLIVTSANGCQDTLTQVVDAHYLPVAAFDLPAPCLPGGTFFYDASSATDTTITSWIWNFGDGSTSTLEDPMHQYGSAATYTITLSVTSGFGCVDDTVVNVAILPGPDASFTVAPASGNLLVDIVFTDGSTPNGSPLDSWLWSFGDGDTSSIQNPTHPYQNEGQYDVQLIVIDEAGCVDTAIVMVPIYHGPKVPNAFSPNGDPNNSLLMVLGGNFETLDFRVYNSWGQLIFSTNDPASLGWDGTFKGQDQPIGVYVYVAIVTTYDGVEHILNGDVSLIR